jgi:predicted Zn finger-like uncharacterized protein
MKVVCPTCNTSYNIPDNKIPQGKRVTATCKRCGGKIIIETRAQEIETEDFAFDTDSGQEFKEGVTNFVGVSRATPELKKTSVILMLFLTAITLGIYYPIWCLKRKKEINNLQSKEKLGSGVFVFAIVAYSLTLLSGLISGFLEGLTGGRSAFQNFLDLAFNILNLVVGISLLVRCFKIRRILQEHFNKSLSAVATFFFQIYYLQYKINRLS